MSTEVIFIMIMGHLLGDYLFQNNWMALGKKKSIYICSVHCIIYAICILAGCSFIMNYPILYLPHFYIFILVALSHFLFDYTELINKYLKLIKGRSWESAIEKFDAPKVTFTIKDARLIRQGMEISGVNLNLKLENYVYLSYTILVQTVIDNSLHLLCNYIILKIFL
jgi:hypothetical protein